MRLLGLFIGVMIVVVACGPTAPTPTAIDTSSQPHPIAGSGEEIYQTQCASCHGGDLEGEADWRAGNADGSFRAPPHDETGHTWHHPDAYLIDRIKNGTNTLDPSAKAKSNMPAYDGILTDEEINEVLAFIKASWPDDIRAQQDRMNQ